VRALLQCIKPVRENSTIHFLSAVEILTCKGRDEIGLRFANKFHNFLSGKTIKFDIATFGIFVINLFIPNAAKKRFGLKNRVEG
jgi:hypothetical protein